MAARTPGQEGTGRPPGEVEIDGGPEHPTEPFARVTGAEPPSGPARNGRVGGTPEFSPWQRSHAVWHRGGVDWVRPAAGDTPVASAAPAPSRPRIRPPRLARTPLILGTATVVLAAVGLYAVLDDGHEARPPAPGATRADRLFALDPAAADGRVQDLAAVAVAGPVAVAAGSETGGGGDRAWFLSTADGGRVWRAARVQAPGGAEAPPGEHPRLLAGGPGGWVALGGSPEAAGSVTAGWVGGDAVTWTRVDLGPAFAGGTVHGLAATGTGFVAVGAAGGTAAAWTSGDGRAWQRAAPPGGVRLDRVAASGAVAVATGMTTRRTTRTVRRGNRNRKVAVTVQEPALWRSADGGRTWTRGAVPQDQGARGALRGPVAGPGGFSLAREAERATGRGRARKVTRYAVAFRSADGAAWAPAGQIGSADYAGLDRLAGSAAGLAALIRVGGGRLALLRSPDGRSWQRAPEDVAEPDPSGLAVLPAGPVLAGRQGDDARLTIAGTGDVDVARIPGAIRPERTIAALVPAGRRLVAVGGSGGDAAIWTAPDGRAWARVQGGELGGDGRQTLTGAVAGPQGWLAVGRHDGDPARPLARTSTDGATWAPAPGFPGEPGSAPRAAAHGPAGYVVVGTAGGAGAGWHSADLRTWTRGTGDFGTGARPLGVAAVPAGPGGYAAVGAFTRDGKATPGVWTSPDGRAWTAGTAPGLPAGAESGELTRVAAHGGVLVALGHAVQAGQNVPFVAVSADAGRTWQAQPLPGGGRATAIVATSRGFVVTGATGAPGAGDAALWSSVDGRAWRQVRPRGTHLDGPGDQWFTAAAPLGGELVLTGVTVDARGEAPTLWRTTLP
ncbi:hypothetical protein DPM19_20570 [Actinomadura craniellae]|uniref:Uncharacterized protein n=1 Tax=Actinomadura craniellae TaxID=2231787 RepID=A0A365H357_9ACTN|nr:hypothetical protein [Actinomadura craniellae]RAY13456.1 hypothetical protein DPM19_20570 [Actinomadura craniellae]